MHLAKAKKRAPQDGPGDEMLVLKNKLSLGNTRLESDLIMNEFVRLAQQQSAQELAESVISDLF